MDCARIKFGDTNHVPDMVLTSVPATANSLDRLKYEWRDRQALWEDVSGEIVISGNLPEARFIEYFVIAGSNLVGSAETQFQVFLNNVPQLTEDFAVGYTPLASLKPLGYFRVGIDPYGELEAGEREDYFAKWLDAPVEYDRFELRIRNFGTNATVLLRMLMMGTAFELDKNFSYGGEISFVTDPELEQISSGAFIQTRSQRKIKAMTFSLDQMTEADRIRFKQMEVTLLGTPFLVSGYPSSPEWQASDYTMVGRLASATKYKHIRYAAHAIDSVTILEA